MRNVERLLFVLTLPLAVLACGPAQSSSPTSEASGETAASVRTIVVEATEVTDLAVLSADLLPDRRATLASEVAGTVEALRVEIGERVQRGSLVASIDTRALRQQVAEAEALFNQAQDRFERAERLFERRSITREKQIDSAAAHEVAQARLASARLALEKSQITAPWTGQVSSRYVEVGDYVGPGQRIVELVAVDRLRVRAPASAADAPYLEIGTPVTLEVDVLPNETFEGNIVRLGAVLDPDTRTLDVEAEIDNSDGRLKPGYFGRLRLPRRVISDALLVPLISVVDFENQKIVYVVESGKAVRRTASLGPVLGQRVVIEDGISSGDRVIVAGLQQVADGLPVVEAESQ